ncbi:E3 ubiquitin-protein ligase PRT1-like isoform X2 [Diospyros lotus]|nr:E3 ubiquitin-protein ligase PRT1-like isoform X2 [Diospyros lotus]
MDPWQESYCPVCRHPYNHFPRICQLLHSLLLKLYPVANRRREQQVIEEEKRLGWSSPQLNIHNGVPSLYATTSRDEVSVRSCTLVEGEPSEINVSSESTNVPHKDEKVYSPAKSTIEDPENVASIQNNLLGDKCCKLQNCKHVLVADLLCAICKELLHQPVVLNCGHVYCKACILQSSDKVPRCPVCQSAHPNGYPKVCLILDQFLEEQFPEQYAFRREAVSKQADNQNGSSSTCSTEASKIDAPSSSRPIYDYLSGRLGQEQLKIHAGVGCDYCGMCPIIGERYRCKDCKEKIGFDLCGGCHERSAKLPGRFNQQHRPEHELEIVKPESMMANVILLQVEEDSGEHDESDHPADVESIPSASSMSADSPEDDGSAAPISSDNALQEDQQATH